MIARQDFGKLAEAILEVGAKKATKYYSPTEVMKATCKNRGRKITEILFTIGKPNFLERKFIKDCQKSGEKFPVSKLQLKWAKPD